MDNRNISTNVSRSKLGLVGVAISILALSSSPAVSADQVRFLTSWYAQAEYGGFYQAKATGIYERYGLDVSISTGGPQVDAMQLILAGEADLATGHDGRIMNAQARDIPVVAVAASFQRYLRCIMAHGDVESLADLGDRSILISSSGRIDWWPWLRDKYGYSDEQVQPYTANLQPFFSNPRLAQQCYISSEPYQAHQRDIDVNVFMIADEGFPTYGGPIITTRSFLENNPDVVKRFVEASMEGWRDYLNNPGPANELILVDNPSMTEPEIAFAIEQYKARGLITGGDAETGGIGVITEARWEATYNFLVEQGLLDSGVNWRNAFTTQIVDQIQVLPD